MNILSMTKEEIAAEMDEMGEKKFRAGQLFSWLHEKKVFAFSDMTNIPKNLRDSLLLHFGEISYKIVSTRHSEKDNTRKYLFDFGNNTIIESVLMEYGYGSTVCVSSQAGCKMGCAFCASKETTFQRDLTAGEMLYQIYAIEKEANVRVSRAVIMGVGEPFDNFENVEKFIALINDKDGHNMGARNITVSTCGIIPKIRRFAHTKSQVNLAISLHAPNNAVRERIMPIAKKYGYDELLDVCAYYVNQTGRRITFEYALIEGVNDSKNDASELAHKIKNINCHVNLIGMNEVDGSNLRKSGKMNEFCNTLLKQGINATIRKKFGGDIDAACGQLRTHRLTGEIQ